MMTVKRFYYPFGEPWLEPEYAKSGQGNRYLFGDKERMFTARMNGYVCRVKIQERRVKPVRSE